MAARAGAMVLTLLLAFVIATVASVVNRIREAQLAVDCANNLKDLAMMIANYETSYKSFPRGSVLNTQLPPEKRLSWEVEVILFGWWTGGGGDDPWVPRWDKSKAWDAVANWPVMEHNLTGATRICVGYENFVCPADRDLSNTTKRFLTNYVGIAGIGQDAAELAPDNARAGFFGYDRLITPKHLKDGAESTIIISETTQRIGHWMEGGPATVRGLVGKDYLGSDGQFSSRHRGLTNFAFADSSVRRFSASIAPEILEALATIAGGEQLTVPPSE